MRAAAALSFSSPWVQASASVSHNKSSSSQSESKDSSSISTISWEAQGGDTLQCNKCVYSLCLFSSLCTFADQAPTTSSPPAWAYTVGSFYNWRVVKQTKVVPLENMISMVPGYQNVKEKFAALLATRDKKETKPEKKPEPVKKTIKFKLFTFASGRVNLALSDTSKSDNYGMNES